MSEVGIAELFQNGVHKGSSNSQWLGILDFGHKRYLATATVEVTLPSQAAIDIEIHQRRSGVRITHKARLAVLKNRKSERLPHLSGTVTLEAKEYEIGCWMCRQADNTKFFLLKFSVSKETEEPVQPKLRRLPRVRSFRR